MTAILHKDYGYGPGGFARYLVNRGLRILPMYWLAVLVSLLLLALLGEQASRAYHSEMGLVVSAVDLVRNLVLVLDIGTPTRWVPPAWALTVELFFYLLMGLGLSRWRGLTLAWLVASLAYTVYLVVGDASFSYRYFTLAAASLPFSAGAAVYHLRVWWHGRNGQPSAGWLRWPVLTLFVANVGLASAGTVHVFGTQFYLNVLLAAGVTWLLADWRAPRLRSIDSAVGTLSYPVYLLHYQAGLCLVLLGYGPQRGEWQFLVPGLGLTLLMSWAMAAAVEPLFTAIRDRIRGGSAMASRTTRPRLARPD
ncbi:MAG: acyltransferase [Burkholderiaceae bacterium]|nr:acyltransferase [Burkholderiaceae bacterium]